MRARTRFVCYMQKQRTKDNVADKVVDITFGKVCSCVPSVAMCNGLGIYGVHKSKHGTI